MSSIFLKRGNSYMVSSREAMDIHEKLPGGNYLIRVDPQTEQLYLEKTEDYKLNFKIYGDVTKMSKRILHSFSKRPVNTGVLLTGEKGSGKTLLAKVISHEASKQGIPTILINHDWPSEAINFLLQAIQQPTIVLFDEFEKVFDKEDQQSMLTLLDGVFESKKMFILTCNNKWGVDEHMRNRPGRIFYMLDFEGLGGEFIREYCEDNLDNKTHTDKIIQIAGTFHQFNFDMLKALVEEMNRFEESPIESLRVLNVKAEFGGVMTFNVKMFEGDREVPADHIEDNGEDHRCNPLQQKFPINYRPLKKGANWTTAYFTCDDLKKIENGGTKYTYTNEKGVTAVLTKDDPFKGYDYRRFIDY